LIALAPSDIDEAQADGHGRKDKHQNSRAKRLNEAFRVIPSLSSETSVRVTAKITAWYDDPDKLRSGYQILTSNGRLENDALDRIQEALEGSGLSGKKTNPQPKYNLTLGPAVPLGSPSPRVAGGTPKYLGRAEGMTSAEPEKKARGSGKARPTAE